MVENKSDLLNCTLGSGRIIGIPFLHAGGPMFALRMLISLGEEIWIFQFCVKILELEEGKWKILSATFHGENRLERELVHFSLILLKQPVCGARIHRGSPMIGFDEQG